MRRSAIIFAATCHFLTSLVAQPQPDSGWVRVVTEPSGISVYVDGSLAGKSPVDSLALPIGRHVIQCQRHGPFRWMPTAIAESIEVRRGETVIVDLVLPVGADDSVGMGGLGMTGGSGVSGGTVLTGPGAWGVKSETWTLTAGGAMIVSGVLAAVFRDKANTAAAHYTQTGDPNSLADVRTYDRLAGASMLAVQVSLGAFVLFLTSQ